MFGNGIRIKLTECTFTTPQNRCTMCYKSQDTSQNISQLFTNTIAFLHIDSNYYSVYINKFPHATLNDTNKIKNYTRCYYITPFQGLK